ncbi:hypothetical protein [Devosia sp. FJ2-5-3]|uniref:hypothetical protein n=1 Tax=Devosia sp. FJ2-5-3 TaxID=2976680 RepID=UPI0023D7FE64|nr:hypothetical protein [Devosia sp. FJ2-5-3]WEJ60186.1 hypothetical protein N0P34_09190 [Devosia sp. FJ2-5-3]
MTRNVSSERVSEEAAWRNLALQFDGHRIDALSMLRFAVRCIEEYATVRDILKLPLSELKAFLAKPPLSGDEVLKQRIELLSLRSSVKTVDVELLIDNAATASQNRTLIDDQVTREAIKLNIVAPLLEAPAASSEVTEEQVERAAKKFHAHQHGQNLDDYGDGEYSRGIKHSMRLALTAALKGERP